MGGVHEKNSDLIFIRMTIDQLTVDLLVKLTWKGEN